MVTTTCTHMCTDIPPMYAHTYSYMHTHTQCKTFVFEASFSYMRSYLRNKQNTNNKNTQTKPKKRKESTVVKGQRETASGSQDAVPRAVWPKEEGCPSHPRLGAVA